MNLIVRSYRAQMPGELCLGWVEPLSQQSLSILGKARNRLDVFFCDFQLNTHIFYRFNNFTKVYGGRHKRHPSDPEHDYKQHPSNAERHLNLSKVPSVFPTRIFNFTGISHSLYYNFTAKTVWIGFRPDLAVPTYHYVLGLSKLACCMTLHSLVLCTGVHVYCELGPTQPST